MNKEAIGALRTYFGQKAVAGILLIAIGAAGFWYLSTHFVSIVAFADEKAKLSKVIENGDSTQQLQILYLRRDLIKNRVEEAEDKVEEKPTSSKWKGRLEDRKTELKVINVEIKEINKKLSDE